MNQFLDNQKLNILKREKREYISMQYINASTAQEALDALIRLDGKGVILAGGSDLIVDFKSGKLHPGAWIDVTRASDLVGISVENDYLVIGAATTLTDIARSPLVKKYFPSLAQGCGSVGSLQIRNSATLTGNVVSAQPAGDGAMALAPLNPVFTIISEKGERTAKISEMYAGFGRSTIDHSHELITKISIPLPKKGEAASFIRLELRKSLSLPMLNCAAMVHVENGKVTWARITMAPVGVGPVRAEEAEEYLVGKEMTDVVLAHAGELSLMNANPRSNPLRGSREFRLETLPVLIQRALAECRAQLV